MKTITLIGSGQMAAALTFPAFENGHRIRLVGSPIDGEVIDRLREDNYHINLLRTLHEGIEYYKVDQIKEALKGADLVVCGVSSFGVDWFADEVLPILDEDVPVLSVTKGMIDYEDGRLQTYVDYWYDRLPKGSGLKIYAVGGPCTARDLADHDPSFVGICGEDMAVMEEMKATLATDYYIIRLTHDVVGLEFAVALKNGYALGTALAIGMAEVANDTANHNNSEAALFMESTDEMRRLIEMVGGGPENIMYAAGDLCVTVAAGRSRTAGILLGKGASMEEVQRQLNGQTVEAIVIATRTARAIRALAKAGKVSLSDYPLLMHVDELLNQNAKLNIPWESFGNII